MRILIVEDNFMSRRILQKILEAYGSCDLASEGREALEAFQMAHRAGAPYGLVILDIVMPGKDGIEVLREIRAWEERKGIQGLDRAKIVMGTAAKDRQTVLGSFRSECDGYITKPFQKKRLLADLAKYYIRLE